MAVTDAQFAALVSAFQEHRRETRRAIKALMRAIKRQADAGVWPDDVKEDIGQRLEAAPEE